MSDRSAYTDFLSRETWNNDAEEVLQDLVNKFVDHLEDNLFQGSPLKLADSWIANNQSAITQKILQMETVIQPNLSSEVDTAAVTLSHMLHLADFLQAMSNVTKAAARSYIEIKRADLSVHKDELPSG